MLIHNQPKAILLKYQRFTQKSYFLHHLCTNSDTHAANMQKKRHSRRHLFIPTSSKHISGLNIHSIPVLKGTGSHSVKKSGMSSAQQANYPQNLFPMKNNPQVCTKGNPPYRHPFKTAIQMILKIKKSYPQKIPHINIIIVLLFKPYILFITLQGNGTAKRKGIFSKN